MLGRVWRKGNPPALLGGCNWYSHCGNTCTPMFTAALFTTARTRKQPRRPATDEWIKKLCYIYTMDCYSAIKRNTSESGLVRWMNLEPALQSEVREKQILYIYAYTCNPEQWQRWTYLQGRNRDPNREQTCGHSRGRRRWDEQSSNETYIIICKTDGYWKAADRELHPVLQRCRRVGGRFKREGKYAYLRMTHAVVYVAVKPTQHSKAIILQIRINFEKVY